MVPDGWEASTLGECVSIRSGGTPSKQNPAFWGGDVPWVSAKDLKSHLISDAQDHLTALGAEHAKMAEQDSVLMLVRGMTLLKDVPIGFVTKPVAFNQDLKALVANDDVDPKFLSYLLVAKKAQMMGLVNTANHGTGRLDTDLLKGLPVDVPPLPEQRKIADILSTWDQAIETTEALLANARTQKRALMQQLLTGKRRFPEFEGQPWKEVRLGDVAKIITGSTPATQTLEYYGGPVPFVSPADLQGQNSLTTAAKTLTTEGASVSRLVPKDAILFSCIGHIGKIAKSGMNVVTNQQINSVVPNADVDPDFLFYELQRCAPRVALLAGHNVIPIINKSEFSLTKVRLPSLAEQSCIAEVLNNQNAVIEEVSIQVTKLRTEKKALMQQLLTGKRRVKMEDHHAV